MADDYPISISISDAAARDSLGRFTASMASAEAAGEKLGGAVSRGMREGGSALDRARAAAEATGTSLAALMGGLGRTGLAFEGLTQAIGREQAMLDKINGPARKYEQHLQTLDSLLAKDRISTEQYAEQVKKLNRELERGSTIKPTQAAPAGGAASAFAPLRNLATSAMGSGGIEGALTVAAGTAIAGAVTHLTGEVMHLANAYGEIHNRLAAVADGTANLNQLMDESYRVAQATRGEWDEIAATYQKIATATEHLGTTQSQVMELTKEIGQGLALSGANAQEQRMTMMELTHAFELGALTGREFKVVLKDATRIVGELATALDIPRAKFIEMGKHGQITAELLMEGFAKAAPSIQAQFDKLTPTLQQSFQSIENAAKKFFGQMFEATGLFKTVADGASVFGTVLATVGDVMKTARGAFDGLAGTLGPVGDALGPVGTAIGDMASPTTLLSAAFLGMTNPVTMLLAALPLIKVAFDGAAEAGQALYPILNGLSEISAKHARAYLNEMDALTALEHQEEKLEQAEHALASARAAGMSVPGFDIEAAHAAAELSRVAKVALGIDIPVAYDKATKEAIAFGTQVEKLGEKHALDEQTEQAKKLEKAMRGASGSVAEYTKHWDGVREKLADVNQALDKIAADRSALASATGKDPAIQMFGKGTQDALDVTRHELKLTREKRDLTDELNNSEYAYGETVVRIRKATAEHKDDLEGVNAAYRDGKITLKEYGEELKKLGVEEDRATVMLREIRKPGLEYTRDVKALNLLLASGRIAFFEYENAIRGVTDAYAGSELREIIEAGTRPAKAPKMVSTVEGDMPRAQFDALRKSDEAVANATFETEQAYARPDPPDLEKDLAAFDAAGASMKATLDGIRGAAREYNRGLLDTNQLLSEGTITSQEHEQAIKKIEEAYFSASHASNDFSDGLARGLHSIRTEIEDVGGQIENTLKNAFHGAEESLVSFVTTGEFGFKKMVQSMLADMTRLLARQAMAGLIGAIGGGLGGGGIASVLGTGATQGFSGLFGSAPGFAFGGEGRVGGSGGPDSQLFVARVTPGEHFKFTPPGQPTQTAAAPAPAPQVRVILLDDESKTRRFFERDGATYHHEWQRQSEPARRGKTTGR